jgi:hypothetical protein
VILPQRNPVVLAKQVATLDVLSGGRVMLGVGAGYLEPEFRAVGANFAERGPVTDEYLDAMRALWYDEHPSCSRRRPRTEPPGRSRPASPPWPACANNGPVCASSSRPEPSNGQASRRRVRGASAGGCVAHKVPKTVPGGPPSAWQARAGDDAGVTLAAEGL